MNSKQALAEARRRWGKNAAVRDEPRFASTDEKREAARTERNRLKLLPMPSDEGERKKILEELNRLLYATYRYRFTVGRIALGMFFAVEGQGDSWKAAFAQCDERKKEIR